VQLPLAHPVNVIIENASKLISAFRKLQLPVVIVTVNPAGAAWTRTRKDPNPAPAIPRKDDWTEITPEILTEESDIFIRKHTWNAFYETGLDEELKKRNITGIVLAGISTSIGVEGTARAASERGYNLTFAADAMTDMQISSHENSLKYIFPRMGETGSTEDIIRKLRV
ncbi:MAG TPA: hydrolase, partial [Sphingobacteriaceae bacterium]|nr:hydrolase [Sphingobacteriaceae bacterium]